MATQRLADMADADEDRELAIGDVVHDREDADPNDAVVVNCPPMPANEWLASR